MENKSASALKCPECGGEFAASDLLDGDSIVTCLNCGKRFATSEIFHKSTDEKVEEIRSKAYTDVEKDRTQAYRDVEEGKRKIEYERMKREFDREDKQEQEAEIKAFKKSKFRIVLIISIIISVMLFAVAFNDGKILAGIVAVIMTALLVVSFLMGNNVIKEKRKNFRLIPAILAFVLFIPCTFLYTGSTVPSLNPQTITMEEISWPKSDIAAIVPIPESTYGKIEWEQDYGFVIYIGNTTKQEYKKYVDLCWDSGFNIDYSRGDDYFWADNEDGHCLTVRYQSGNVMFIRIDAKGHGFNQ